MQTLLRENTPKFIKNVFTEMKQKQGSFNAL